MNLRPQLVGANSIVLAWDAPGAVDHYESFANGVPGGTTSVATAVVTGLTCGTQVAFGVDAVAGGGQHSSRATLSVTPPCPPPGSRHDSRHDGSDRHCQLRACEPDDCDDGGDRVLREQSCSVFECSLDTAAFAACGSPAWYSGIADGAHTFQVRATDAVGNACVTRLDAWTTDRTPPDTTITSTPLNPAASRDRVVLVQLE